MTDGERTPGLTYDLHEVPLGGRRQEKGTIPKASIQNHICNSKWIKDPRVRDKTIKPLKENVGASLCDLGYDTDNNKKNS